MLSVFTTFHKLRGNPQRGIQFLESLHRTQIYEAILEIDIAVLPVEKPYEVENGPEPPVPHGLIEEGQCHAGIPTHLLMTTERVGVSAFTEVPVADLTVLSKPLKEGRDLLGHGCVASRCHGGEGE